MKKKETSVALEIRWQLESILLGREAIPERELVAMNLALRSCCPDAHLRLVSKRDFPYCTTYDKNFELYKIGIECFNMGVHFGRRAQTNLSNLQFNNFFFGIQRMK